MSGKNPLLGGVAEIANGRWIQWSLEWFTFPSRRTLKLIEKCFATDISDNVAYLEFDGKRRRGKLFETEPSRNLYVDTSNFICHSPSSETFHDRAPSIYIDALQYESGNSSASFAICISHFDGTVQKLTIKSDDSLGSFLSPLSVSSNGKAILNHAVD